MHPNLPGTGNARYVLNMVYIGTCGYGDYRPGANWKERYDSKIQAYADRYSVLELNKTFYSLPMEKTASRWREEAGEELKISVKAWMAVTHPTNSPVWRKRKDKLDEQQLEEFGNLRWNQSVRDAWQKTLRTAEALNARAILVQTPGKFGYSEENEETVRNFFSQVAGEASKAHLRFAWEPRGDWVEHREVLSSIFEDFGVIHVTDILRRPPLSGDDLAYVRLHGLNEREFNYRYDYSRDQLERLADTLLETEQTHGEVYCLFNNDHMYENADTLKEILAAR